ncbi:MAG TPA: hypothetical protein VMU67_00375 [Steroidobacteraceae bacterium]|nr:hypothetical protein [Steroidobacteraceae bacterium]
MSFELQSDEIGLRRALASLHDILIPEETLEAWATQRRMFALAHRRLIVAATSGRLVWIERKLLGGFDLRNVRWQDLEDVSLAVGTFGADLIVRTGRVADLASEGSAGTWTYRFAGLRKAQAQAVYRICQAQDQAWREKRRVRELEELRARSGGLQLASGAFPQAPSAAGAAAAASGAAAPDAAHRLLEARKLLDERLITDSEYEAIKARILSSS